MKILEILEEIMKNPFGHSNLELKIPYLKFKTITEWIEQQNDRVALVNLKVHE